MFKISSFLLAVTFLGLTLDGEVHAQTGNLIHDAEHYILKVKSIVKQQYKFHLLPSGSNPIGAAIFDLYKNPREDRPQDSILYGVSLARTSHTLSVNFDNLSRHLRPQVPSPCQFDNVLRYLRTNLTQHLAQLTSRECEKCGLGANFVQMMKRHLARKQQYPDREPARDIPYGGIENLRPETKELIDRMKKNKKAPSN